MIKKISFIFFLVLAVVCNAQLQELQGVITANGEVEGIHVLNKTSVKYTVTDAVGNFTISVKANDTLVFSALKYKVKEVVVKLSDITKNNFRVTLEEKINELEEVTVGRILTGNLGSDLTNTEIQKPVNFYDLGINGSKKLPKTIEKRKLADADGGSWGYIGIGFSVNFHKLLNRISGRTKRLKEIVELTDNDKCMKRLKDSHSESLLKKEELTEPQQYEYFYFCMDDPRFTSICQQSNPIEVISFLEEKLKVYKINLNSDKN